MIEQTKVAGPNALGCEYLRAEPDASGTLRAVYGLNSRGDSAMDDDIEDQITEAINGVRSCFERLCIDRSEELARELVSEAEGLSGLVLQQAMTNGKPS